MKQQKLTEWMELINEPFIVNHSYPGSGDLGLVCPGCQCLQIARFQPIYREERGGEQLGRGWSKELD